MKDDSPPLLMVAPNGARRTQKDHPALPLQINDIAQTAATCQAAGAGAIHAHVRDSQGAHCLDVGLYRELMRETSRQAPGMAVQISTESIGRYTPAQQRQLLHELRPPWASVALSEMLSDGDSKSAARLYHWAASENIRIQHILYRPQEAMQLAQLTEEGVIPGDEASVLFVLGRAASPPAAPEMLPPFLSVRQRAALPMTFMVCAFGRQETDCLLAAAAAGGDCRIGFENNFYQRNGDIAADNAARVGELVAALRDERLNR